LNKDKELSFEEFTIVLSKLADDAHRISHGSERYFLGCLIPAVPQAQQSQEPLSELEKAMDAIIDVFHQYSRREGDRDTLSKGELRLLIEKQLANYLR
ncbi:M126 protein, partial [Rhabdornis inornatus]|nr:M126 protein [Rhabdornis inornatus]